jgi:hypothetical protein
MESITSGNLDADGANEIFLGMGNGSLMVTSFNGADLIWEYYLPLGTREITHLGTGDVDDDGDLEIIAVEGHTGISWNENFVFRSASSDCIVYVIGYQGPGYVIEKQLTVDVGSAFCAEVGDVDNDGVPEILLGGTGYDEVNEDPFVGQIEVIDFDGSDYTVVWESIYFSNWVMGVAIGDIDGDSENEMVTEDYDEGLESNVLRLYEYNGATYVEFQTVNIDSENFALDIGDSDNDLSNEMVTKGIFSGLLEVFGQSGNSYSLEWSSGQFSTFIDECIEITNVNVAESEYLIFGELGVFIFENTGGTYQQIWHSDEIPASVKNLHVSDVDMFSGKEIIGSSGGYNFIYGEAGDPVPILSVSYTHVNTDETIIFDGSQSQGAGQLSYYFDFGDGQNTGWITNSQTSHSYSTPGVYSAYLRIQDGGGTQSPTVDTVTIYVSSSSGAPIAIIDSISPNPALEGDTVTFTGHGIDDGNIVDYEWSSSLNGYLGDDTTFQYTGLAKGTHNISFKVKNDNGIWSDPVTTTLKINTMPEADIDSVTPSQPNVGDLVKFEGHGEDDGAIMGYNWRSNIEGFLSNSDSFSTTILSSGSHIIYFKVLDSDGIWSDEDTKSIYVNQYPTAIIESITPNGTIVGELVFFVGDGEDDQSIAGYNWESDIDGFLSSRAEFNTFSLSPGMHTISFTVRDSRDAWSQPDIRTITILELPENIRPVAIIESVSPSKIKEGEEVTLIGYGEDEDGSIEDYYWESDLDGLLSDQRSFSIEDLTVGTHIITFQVRDDKGAWSDSTEVAVEVEEKKDEDFFSNLDFANPDFDALVADTQMCILLVFIFFIIIFIIISIFC